MNKQKSANQSLQSEIDSISGRSSTEPGSRTRDASGRATPTAFDGELSRRFQTLQIQHSTIQAELSASRDVLAAREREVELLRQRVDEAEKELDGMREELGQAQARIETLLEMGQGGFAGSEDGDGVRSEEGSEEASMAFDKVRQPVVRSFLTKADEQFSKELKQWDRTRGTESESEDDDTAQYNHHLSHVAGAQAATRQAQSPQTQSQSLKQGAAWGVKAGDKTQGHKRNSSGNSGDWTQ